MLADRISFVQVAIVLLALGSPARADDWPQWRGPTRDGVWHETGIVEKFNDRQIPWLWSTEIGSGYSGPTVAEGRVYVTDRVRQPTQIERVHCFDARDGKKVWSHEYESTYSIGYEAGPRASVSIDDGRAYALGGMGHLHCYDATTGELHWKHDLNAEYKIRMPIWGISASPLVDGGLVIVQIGGADDACLVAFDKVTGKQRWRALSDEASYAAPLVIEQAGKRVLLCLTGNNVVGLEPATGKIHWKVPFPPRRMVIAISTPVVSGNRVFVTSFYDGSLMVGLDEHRLEAKELWRRMGRDEKMTDALHSIISTPLFLGNYVYGVDSYGELRCLDAATGDRLWTSTAATPPARWSTIHMVVNGKQVWMFNERGELLITRLSPQGYEEISRTKLIDPTTDQLRQRGGVCWAHPAYADRCVFARNDKQLVCASLAAE
ncbi:MAG TPA: PQQ-binding-like beta-propeller repeat protein [Pirellulales bacterium]|jgi:outer membrane protein assembly factor BamB|nr:PQQ-binding-like beta-propeller repeat protein [Pirellulales bacterium]